jgi:hypothetical protein
VAVPIVAIDIAHVTNSQTIPRVIAISAPRVISFVAESRIYQ